MKTFNTAAIPQKYNILSFLDVEGVHSRKSRNFSIFENNIKADVLYWKRNVFWDSRFKFMTEHSIFIARNVV